jgi:hypothetical protein
LYAPLDWSKTNIQKNIESLQKKLTKLKADTAQYVKVLAEKEAYEEVLGLMQEEDENFMKNSRPAS